MVTCIYRRPSSQQPNNKALCDLITEIERWHKQLKLLVGDFNYPSILWDNLHITRDNNAIRDPQLFKETIIDAYMILFVNFPTRARGTDNPSCIYWLFANNEVLINGIKDCSPLRGGDCIMIETDCNITPKDTTTTGNHWSWLKVPLCLCAAIVAVACWFDIKMLALNWCIMDKVWASHKFSSCMSGCKNMKLIT